MILKYMKVSLFERLQEKIYFFTIFQIFWAVPVYIAYFNISIYFRCHFMLT